MEVKTIVEKTLTETVGDVTVIAKVRDGKLVDIDFRRATCGLGSSLKSEWSIVSAFYFVLENLDGLAEFLTAIHDLITGEEVKG